MASKLRLRLLVIKREPTRPEGRKRATKSDDLKARQLEVELENLLERIRRRQRILEELALTRGNSYTESPKIRLLAVKRLQRMIKQRRACTPARQPVRLVDFEIDERIEADRKRWEASSAPGA